MPGDALQAATGGRSLFVQASSWGPGTSLQQQGSGASGRSSASPLRPEYQVQFWLPHVMTACLVACKCGQDSDA